jgi:hypothetical protein
VNEVGFDHVRGLWEDGERRLRALDPSDRAPAERVTNAIVDELRRRLGGTFTAQQLADLYVREGADWCLEVAMRTEPSNPAAWEIATVAGAAFARYLRAASDFGGGRRIFRTDEGT